MAKTQFDYIVVGGGSAGSVLANRLSENNKVLLLEAGGFDSPWELFIHMPAGLTHPIGNPRYDWGYESEPEPHMGGRKVYHARGRILGGSSSINGMIFQRGNPMDYQRWAADPGMENWDYASCLPYFKKMENCLAGTDEFRGGDGPLKLERGPGANPLFSAFLKATEEAGHPRTNDVNGYRQEGFGLFDRNIHRGRRMSASKAYLHPILSRSTLWIRTGVLTTKILFEKNRAVGVEYCVMGNMHEAFAGEVIICGGAINSPQLMMLSGVGPAEHLKSHDIDVLADMPGVGSNLQDHLEVYVQYACKKPISMNPQLKWWRAPWIGFQWLFLRSGPAATNHFEAGGFIRSNDQEAYPNLMFHFLPLAIRYDGSAPSTGHGYQVHVGPMYSDARGTVRLASNDPFEYPKLQFNYLSTDQDRREWVEAIQHAREILNQPAMQEFNGGEISPGPEVKTEDEILKWVARDAETALHPSCTLKMGRDSMAVVDPDSFEVHGLQGLRVCDASIMPYITNANIYAPVMMMAERAADVILGNSLAPKENVRFYRAETNG